MHRWSPTSAVRVLAALLACVTLALTGCSSSTAAQPAKASGGTHSAAAHGLPAVPASRLPPEARHTLQLIASGGPFPYAQDGVVFGNYEGVLPHERRGYYHEFTVDTPGSRTRGTRRIITGAGHETYYTDDHYRTFKEVTGR